MDPNDWMGRLYALGGGECPIWHPKVDNFSLHDKRNVEGIRENSFEFNGSLRQFFDGHDMFRDTGFPTSVFVGEKDPEMPKADWCACFYDDEEESEAVMKNPEHPDISNMCPQIEELEKSDLRTVISSESAVTDGRWDVTTEGMTEFENIMLMMFLSMANL